MLNIPEGDYTATVTESYLGYNRFGDQAACITFAIKDGPHTGVTVSWDGAFDGEWKERTVRSLRHCGWRGSDLFTLSQIVGEVASITVKHKLSQKGSTFLQVFINPARRAMSETDGKAFAAKMKKAIENIDHEEQEETPRSSAPPQQRSTADALGVVDDDCPF